MNQRVRHAVVPCYLLLCLFLGGSAQGVWGNLVLQLVGVGILAWALWADDPVSPSRSARQLGWTAAGSILLILLQLIPLPPAVWTLLPGRAPAVTGFRLLGEPLPWLPLSLTPYDSLSCLPPLIPPLAILAAMLRGGVYRSSWLAAAIVLGALASILLGAMQATTGYYYLYPYSSLGSATGFFANGNFLGTLLLTAVAYLAALTSRGRGDDRRGGPLLAIGPLLVLLVGLALSRSLAALLLTLPVVLASVLLFGTALVRSSKWVAWVAAGAAVLALAGYTRLPALTDPNNAVSSASRATIYRTTGEAIAEVFPAGSGAGSFARVYALHEQPAAFQGAYVNHAHNDYLEIALEFGLPGLALLAWFLWWWVGRAIAIWRSPASSAYARAASIASAAILAHSLVDFPARNAALASVLAASVALMAEPRRWSARVVSDERPARHLTLS
ncbi:O-antigen ligase family protein [Sphingomonas sp. BN140010]|uniref:O-antigen ligase family protein n=1 Tax=Sphingomonas arvum TaxID=2992113 RepID=A0ABT3JDC9_9SPHN|nr:O-antigen ligase family protein [Sphingomonas sp. BN140010]MCW3797079.1 O-antigen ligase family protein [Sphingomonas sp. BN140010]